MSLVGTLAGWGEDVVSVAEQIIIREYIAVTSGPGSLPVISTLQDKVSLLVQQRNNQYPPLIAAPTSSNDAKGTALHRIDVAQAAQIAALVMDAPAHGLTVPYVLACLCIESLFDPACENGNFLGSNPAKAPEGYDVGIAQLKLKYLPYSVDAARAFALDPAQAIPYFIGVMSDLVVQAEGIAAVAPAGSPFQSIPYVATGAYNFGVSGMRKVVAAGKPPEHCEVVKTLETTFAGLLGLPSCFAS